MTDATSTPDRVVARVREDQAAWRDLVTEVGEDRMLEPGPMGEWSFRDLAAHLLGWRDRTIARLEASAVGDEEPREPWPDDMEGDDAINDWFQQQSAGRSVAEILQAIDRSYDRLAAALGALPEATLTDPRGLPWLEGTAASETDWLSHLHDEHEPTIRAWLQRRG